MSSRGRSSAGFTSSTSASTKVMTRVKLPRTYWKLCSAIQNGDWNAVQDEINKDGNILMANITMIGDMKLNMLEFAIATAQDRIALNLIGRMSEEAIVSALNIAAKGGRIMIIKAIIRDRSLSADQIGEVLSIIVHNLPKQKKIIWYLARQIGSSTPPHNITEALLTAGHSDICLYIARGHIDERMSKEIINHLANMRTLFASGARLRFWSKCFYKCISICMMDTEINQADALALTWFKTSLWKLSTRLGYLRKIGELKMMHHCTYKLATIAFDEMGKLPACDVMHFFWTTNTLIVAAHWGITELMVLCLERYPELLWNVEFAKNLVIESLKQRNAELFGLLNARIVVDRNRILGHESLMRAVIENSQENIAEAPFLLQRDLQWFKAVEDMILPLSITKRRMYWDEFMDTRQDMLREGKTWMQQTSRLCILLAFIIAYAGVFTLLGGKARRSMFINESRFVISNGLAIFFALYSNFMFLAIITSRYHAKDFLYSLQRKLILGIGFLWLSLASIMVSFCNALTLMMKDQGTWIYILMIAMGGYLICLFLTLELFLFIEVVKSTFWPRLFRT